MTTIATDGRTIASDSRASDEDDGTACRVQKLHRLPDGRIIGYCGDAGRGWRLVKWLIAGSQGKRPLSKGAAFLVLGPDGVECSEDGWLPYPVIPPVAIGSGGKAAMVAMYLGKTPTEAIAEAIRVDIFSAGPVVTLQVEKDSASTKSVRKGISR